MIEKFNISTRKFQASNSGSFGCKVTQKFSAKGKVSQSIAIGNEDNVKFNLTSEFGKLIRLYRDL